MAASHRLAAVFEMIKGGQIIGKYDNTDYDY